MATKAQIKANKANSLKSTGPKTKKGKNTSKLNALKHGLQAEHLLLPWEDEQRFSEFRDELVECLAPEGPLEFRLIEQVVIGMWRLRRVCRIEAGIMSVEVLQVEMKSICSDAEMGGFLGSKKLDDKNLDVTKPEWFKNTNPAQVHDMKKVRELSKTELSITGFAFLKDASGPNALMKLTRYETSIERSMYRALDKLEHLQERRNS